MLNERRLMHAHRLNATLRVLFGVFDAFVYSTTAVTLCFLSLRRSGSILMPQRPLVSGLASALIFLPSMLNVTLAIAVPLTSRRNALVTHFFGLATKSATPDFTASPSTCCCGAGGAGCVSAVSAVSVAFFVVPLVSWAVTRATLLIWVCPGCVW